MPKHFLARLCAVLLAGLAGAATFGGIARAQVDAASIVTEWAASAHADATAQAFNRWNAEGAVPAECALCHSGAGFRDFYGLDGSPAGAVDAAVPVGGVIDCDTCHAKGADAITEVKFPSGVTLAVEAKAAPCMTCHQGRQAGARIAAAAGDADPDTVVAELSFINPHYAAAAATLFGAEAAGLYQYPDKSYAGRFAHVPGASTCTECHSPHSLEVATETCAACHKTDDPRAIRGEESPDLDGDGDTTEGVAQEFAALHEKLGAAILVYGRDVAGSPVVYAPGSHPYFFADLNGNGVADPEEAVRDNRYASWTPRMLAAAFNFQFIGKDPGAFAHNPRYMAQILLDSIEDLTGEAPAEGVRP